MEVLTADLGSALARAHDVRRIDGLIGGDQHKRLAPRLARKRRHVPRAHDVIPDRCVHLLLQHRHMLVGRGMEYHIRSVLLECRFDGSAVADVGEQVCPFQIWKRTLQFEVDRVEIELAAIQNDQAGRLELCDLAAELGADRAAAAGNQHRLARQFLPDRSPIQLDGFPPQQVLDLHIAHLLDADLSRDQVLHAR